MVFGTTVFSTTASIAESKTETIVEEEPIKEEPVEEEHAEKESIEEPASSEKSSSVDSTVPKEVTDNPNEEHGYAVVREDGTVSNIVVCSYSVCGANNDWLDTAIRNGAIEPGSRLVLQTLKDKETGNVAGYREAKYDSQTNSFTVTICNQMGPNGCTDNGETVQIPVAYPGSKEPTCISNCNVVVENNENIIENQQISIIEEKTFPMIFSTNLKPNSLAKVIAKNKKRTKIWKTEVDKKGIVKIKVNKKYQKWNFQVKSRS